jgi:hypothetical protein
LDAHFLRLNQHNQVYGNSLSQFALSNHLSSTGMMGQSSLLTPNLAMPRNDILGMGLSSVLPSPLTNRTMDRLPNSTQQLALLQRTLQEHEAAARIQGLGRGLHKLPPKGNPPHDKHGM